MKKSVLKMLAIGFLVMGSSSAIAGQTGWVVSAKVKTIVATGNGGIDFRLVPELSGCVSQSGYGALYASVYPDNPALKNIQSILLAAYMADKPVAVWFSDTNCTVGEVELGGRI
jgi:hypothetical protein